MNFVYADSLTEYTPLVTLPGFEKISLGSATALDDYLNNMFKLGIGLTIAFAIIMIVIGGIQYYTTDAVSGKGEGKDRITGALWGLLLALLSVLILQTINPQLLSTKLDIKMVDIEGIETPENFVEGDPGDDSIDTNEPIASSTPPTVNGVCEKDNRQLTSLQDYINCGCFAAKDKSGNPGTISPMVAYVKANLGSLFPGLGLSPVSDFRSVAHNHKVGGATKSDHLTGDALDIGDGNKVMDPTKANTVVNFFRSSGDYNATKVIYNKTIYTKGGSGGASDHVDHVHISFAHVECQ